MVEVCEALREGDIDPTPALKLDTKSLEKLLLAASPTPAFMERVRAMAVDKSYTRFDSRTHKEEPGENH